MTDRMIPAGLFYMQLHYRDFYRPRRVFGRVEASGRLRLCDDYCSVGGWNVVMAVVKG